MSSVNLKPLVIMGAGGLGREVAWLVNDINKEKPKWDLIGFLDDYKTGKTVEGYPILGKIEDISNINPTPWCVIAIADSKARRALDNMVLIRGINLATLIHPSVNMSEHVLIGEGSIICAGSIITTNIKLGRCCIVNPGGFIGHDTVLNDYVSMMPGTNLAGEVIVGEGCYFGLNSCVINRTAIGDWSVIGAGATVIDDIPACSVAVGVPARVIKKTDGYK